MSNNNPFNLPIPTGSNDNSNKKRKQRTYLSAAGDTTMSKKRQNTLSPGSTPVVPPAQPNFGYGTPQVANPPAYAPQSIPFAGAPPGYPPGYPPSTFGSTSFSPQYPQFQAQAHWPQQQPQQHAPQQNGCSPGYHLQPTPAILHRGLSAGQQQQVTPQLPRNSQRAQFPFNEGLNKPTEMLRADEIDGHGLNAADVPAEVTAKGRPGKRSFVVQTADPHMSTATWHGAKGFRVNKDQYAYHAGLYGGQGRHVTIMRTMHPMSNDMPPVVQTLQASTSTAGLSTANRGPLRQRPGTNPAQPPAQPPVQPPVQPPARLPARPPAQDQGPPPGQGQDLGRCPNCDKPGHLVGDCVGPPNRVHGDVPACSICNTFGGRDKDGNQLDGHRFDGCERISMLLDKYRWDQNRRIPYKDLASLTNDELHIIFDALVVRRLRKAPIRTKLFCWIDVLRETARRGDSSKVAAHVGYMTPWTKAFAIQQRNVPKRPWDDFDYAARDLSKLPLGPAEHVEGKWEDLVANGLQFPPQVYDSGDRQRLAENLDVEPEVRDRREEGRNHIANRDNGELNLAQGDESMREEQRTGDPTEGSLWKAIVILVSKYLAGLNPIHSGSYGLGFRELDEVRLLRALTQFLATAENQDRFTAFLEADSKPDGWYCVEQICSAGQDGFEPVDGRCVWHQDYAYCPLQVRHLDAASGGRILDCRAEVSDGGDHEGYEDI